MQIDLGLDYSLIKNKASQSFSLSISSKLEKSNESVAHFQAIIVLREALLKEWNALSPEMIEKLYCFLQSIAFER